MGLEAYYQKRDFKKTSEPKGTVHSDFQGLFVIQKHAARRLHYDFRLELDGVLKSWAIPKGPCLDPKVKRLAVHVEDHPLEYGEFEGLIPKGEYGAGTVMLWDKGQWQPLDEEPLKAYKKGHLRFELQAEKLKGSWSLIRFKHEEQWFLMKHQDEEAIALEEYDITEEKPLSVLSGQTMEEISLHCQGVWTRKGYQKVLSQDKALTEERLQFLAPKSPFPQGVSVQLATLADKPPKGDEWLHEMKFDGYRMLAMKQGKEVEFFSRTGKNWTAAIENLSPAIQALPCETAILDGEIVLLNEDKRPDFQLLQNAIKGNHKESPYQYYLFDLVYLNGYDLRTLTLIERKELLSALIANAAANLHYSTHIVGQGEKVFTEACSMAFEGIISKWAESAYSGKRSSSWLKIKCLKGQEFLIGGYSKPKNSREYFGSLFLGVFDERQELLFCGNVGTGFNHESLKAIYEQLQPLVRKENPFTTRPPNFRTATWVEPKLIAEVDFSEWTQDGHLRHPSFKGLRRDKKPSQIVREPELAIDKLKPQVSARKKIMIKLTHPDKILYKEDKITKQQLYDYYDKVADYILAFISDRPLTLVRCPSGYETCFYQKHLNHNSLSLYPVPVKNKEGKVEDYVALNDKEGLLSLVQMGVLEIHPWGSKVADLEKPDQLVFDLDPADDLEWKAVVAAAFEIRKELEHYQLSSFVKTTGGKGLHVVIPIEPEYDWDFIKHFTQVFVNYLVKKQPRKYIAEMAKSKRKGKIFVDYLRNQRDATAIAAYSTRARLHAPVSTPLAWEELSEKKEDNFFTIKTLPQRLKHLTADPWQQFWSIKQSLKALLK